MTETLLNCSEATKFIRKNADPACCLNGLNRRTLYHWLIDDYGPVAQSVDGTWRYSREDLDDFIEIQGLMAKGVIKPCCP